MSALPIWLDCDPGQDDAIALLYALGSEKLSVEGVTVVGGNVDVRQCARNAQQILELAGCPRIPVHLGAEKPLKRPLKTLPEVFGETGMAGAEDLPLPQSPLAAAPARKALCALPQGQTLVATGPLTNVAEALMDDPSLASRIPRLFLMGGCPFPEPLRGKMGNLPIAGTDAHAEYNFAVDPEAAQIVFAAGIPEIYLAGLNVTRVLLYNSRIDARLRALGRRCATKAAEILSVVGEDDLDDYGHLRQTPNDPVRAIHDLLAMAFCEDQSLITFETHPIKIVTDAPPAAAGQSLISQNDYDHPAVHIATAVDEDRLVDALIANLGRLP